MGVIVDKLECVKPNIHHLKKLEHRQKLIFDKAQEERERVALAIKVGVCPTCGCEIIEELYERYDQPKKYFFDLITCSGKFWDYRKICSNNKRHYEDKGHYENSEYGY